MVEGWIKQGIRFMMICRKAIKSSYVSLREKLYCWKSAVWLPMAKWTSNVYFLVYNCILLTKLWIAYTYFTKLTQLIFTSTSLDFPLNQCYIPISPEIFWLFCCFYFSSSLSMYLLSSFLMVVCFLVVSRSFEEVAEPVCRSHKCNKVWPQM